jgi:hypothetical protein
MKNVLPRCSAWVLLLFGGVWAGCDGPSNPFQTDEYAAAKARKGGTTRVTATGGVKGSGGSKATGGVSATGGTMLGSGGATALGGNAAGGAMTIVLAPGDQWVSLEGDDANPGSKEKPLKNLQTAILRAPSGSTIWMMPGTHSYESRIGIQSASVGLNVPWGQWTTPAIAALAQDGTAEKPTRIMGVEGSRPVIDFSPQKKRLQAEFIALGSVVNANLTAAQRNSRGIALNVQYWHLKNLEIRDAADNCIYVVGSNNVIEDVIVHHCGDTGIQITGLESDLSWVPSHNKVINCDSYLNIDDVVGDTNQGAEAGGFAAKLAIGPGNEFRGCRTWQNVADGWNFFAAQHPVVVDNGWAFDMNHPNATAVSKKNGFVLGGSRSATAPNNIPHKLTNCFAFASPGWGFALGGNISTLVTCDGCGAWENKLGDFETGIIRSNDVAALTVSAEKARTAKRDASGNLPLLKSL